MAKKLKVIDLFSGAGGLSCGLELAGFHSIAAMELVPVYSETYRANNPEAVVINSDIRLISGSELMQKCGVKPGEVDLLAGGPPCQGFSINAPVRSFDDPRNHLFKEFLRLAKELSPKAVLIENVTGIVSFGKGKVIELIREELEALGYDVQYRILFAGHYGVPQTRFRTFIIGIRKDVKVADFEFPFPTHFADPVKNFSRSKELCFSLSKEDSKNLHRYVTVEDALSDIYDAELGQISTPYPKKASTEFQKTIRNGSSGLTDHACPKTSHVMEERFSHIPMGGSWRDIPFELLPNGLKKARRSDHTKRYGRLDPKGMCSTVLTKCDPHWGSFIHPLFNRTLTVREAARMQSFPDNYVFLGNMSERYEQIGNAVPPLLAKAVGMAILKSIKHDDKASE